MEIKWTSYIVKLRLFLHMVNEWIIDFLVIVIVKLVTIEEDFKII